MNPIEIFRPGRHTARSGETIDFRENQLREAAQAYDPGVHEAPIVVGHPRHDAPAYGWVGSLRFNETLEADPVQVDPEFAEMVRAGRFKKVSASFYRPDSPENPVPGTYYLRHVGFFGAQPPAVKGLKQAEFSEGAQGVVELEFNEMESAGRLKRILRGLREWVIEMAGREQADRIVPEYELADLEHTAQGGGEEFSETEVDAVATDAEKERIQREAKEAARREVEAEFAEREEELTQAERQQRRKQHEQFVDGLVAEGKVLPKHRDGLVEYMETQDTAAAIEFGEGDGAVQTTSGEFFRQFLQELPQAVDYGERAPSDDPDEPASYKAPEGYTVDPKKAQLRNQALAYQEQHNCDYVTAVAAVQRGGQ